MVDLSFTNPDVQDNSLIVDAEQASLAETPVKPHLVLALDYGVKKMGMALGNSLTETARATSSGRHEITNFGWRIRKARNTSKLRRSTVSHS